MMATTTSSSINVKPRRSTFSERMIIGQGQSADVSQEISQRIHRGCIGLHQFTHPGHPRRHLPHAFDTHAINRTAKGGKKGRMETRTKEISVCGEARLTLKTWEHGFRRSKHLILNCIQPIPLYSGSKNKNKNRGTDILSTLHSTAAKDGSVSIFLVSASRNSQIRVHLCPSVVQSSAKIKITKRTHFGFQIGPINQSLTTISPRAGKKTNPFFHGDLRPPTSDLRLFRILHSSFFIGFQSCPVVPSRSKRKIYSPKTAENLLFHEKRRIIALRRTSNEMNL